MFATISDKAGYKHSKHPFIVGCLLLGLAAVPDAMVVPVLYDLTSARFGVSQGTAHYFMAINLLGAIGAIGLLALLKRRFSSSVLFVSAALISAILMASMAMTSSLSGTVTIPLRTSISTVVWRS